MKALTPEIQRNILNADQIDAVSGVVRIRPGTPQEEILEYNSFQSEAVDGDVAGPARIVLADPSKSIFPHTDVLIEGGYADSNLPVWRGFIEDFAEVATEPDRRDCGCNESIQAILDREVITRQYNEDERGVLGVHSGPWVRSEIITDIAIENGLPVGFIEPTTKEVEIPSFVGERLGDVLAFILQPEFLKARINESRQLEVRQIRLSGPEDFVVEEGVNLASIDNPRFSQREIINEVLVIGKSKDEVQIAHPPSDLEIDRQPLNPLQVIQKVIDLPRSVADATLQHELRAFETAIYTEVSESRSFTGNGSQTFVVEFPSPSGPVFNAIKNVSGAFSAGGDQNTHRSLSVVFSDGSSQLITSFSGQNHGPDTTFNFTKPVRGFVVSISSFTPGGFFSSSQPRPFGGRLDLTYTPMTEREQFEHSDNIQYVTSVLPTTTSGAVQLGEIISQRIAVTETTYEIRLESTWRVDPVEAEATIRGRLWSQVRPRVLFFRSTDNSSIAKFGRKSILIENEAITDQAEADQITSAVLASSSLPLEEWSFTLSGHPHIEPADICKLIVHREDLVQRFGSEQLLYLLSVRQIQKVTPKGGKTFRTECKGILASRAALSVFRNLGASIVKLRADTQADYYRDLLLCRIVRVHRKNLTDPGVSSVLPRTDANLYDIILLTEPEKIIKNVPNSFTESYLETDTAFILFQNGNKQRPWLVGRADRLFVVDGDSTRAAPPVPDPTVTKLTIDDSPFPPAVENQAYSFSKSAEGGLGDSFAWNIVYGSLPPGLSIVQNGSATCQISGTPTIIGLWPFALRVKDNLGNIDIHDFTIEVLSVSAAQDNNPPNVVVIEPTNGDIITGDFNLKASASDDVGVTRVDALVNGNVVAWKLSAPWEFNIDSSAFPNGPATINARARDAANNQTMSATVNVEFNNATPSLLVINSTTLPDGEETQSYFAEIFASGGSNTDYTWSVNSGSLPPGLSLTSGTPAATLSGTPTAEGDYTFELLVEDSFGNTDTQSFNLKIAGTTVIGFDASQWKDNVLNGEILNNSFLHVFGGLNTSDGFRVDASVSHVPGSTEPFNVQKSADVAGSRIIDIILPNAPDGGFKFRLVLSTGADKTKGMISVQSQEIGSTNLKPAKVDNPSQAFRIAFTFTDEASRTANITLDLWISQLVGALGGA